MRHQRLLGLMGLLLAVLFMLGPLGLFAQDAAPPPAPTPATSVTVLDAILTALTKVAPILVSVVVTPWLTHGLQSLSGQMSPKVRYLTSITFGALLSAVTGAGLDAPAVEVQADAGLGGVAGAAGQSLKDAPAKPRDANAQAA